MYGRAYNIGYRPVSQIVSLHSITDTVISFDLYTEKTCNSD